MRPDKTPPPGSRSRAATAFSSDRSRAAIIARDPDNREGR
jgi:hypothetical protein